MKLLNTSLLDDLESDDMSDDIAGPTIDLNQIYGFSLTVACTGSPVGILSIQVSNETVESKEKVSEGSWETLAGSPTSISSAGQTLFNVDRAFYRWTRFFYAFTSGTGNISVVDLTLKGV